MKLLQKVTYKAQQIMLDIQSNLAIIVLLGAALLSRYIYHMIYIFLGYIQFKIKYTQKQT